MWRLVFQNEPRPLQTSEESIDRKHKYRNLKRNHKNSFNFGRKMCDHVGPNCSWLSCCWSQKVFTAFNSDSFALKLIIPSIPLNWLTQIQFLKRSVTKCDTEKVISPCNYVTTKQCWLRGCSLWSGEICCYGVVSFNNGVTVSSRRVGGAQITPRNRLTDSMSPTDNYIYILAEPRLYPSLNYETVLILWSANFMTGLLLRVWRLWSLLGAVSY